MRNKQQSPESASAASSLAPYFGWLSRAFAIAVGLAFPAAYFALQLQFHQGSLNSEANLNAAMVAHKLIERLGEPNLLNAAGGELELHESVERDIDDNEYNARYETRTLLNSSKQSVVRSGADAPAWPVVAAESEIRHGGQLLGYFRIERSLAPVLAMTAWFALLGGGIAWAMCFVMSRLPALALRQAQQRLSHLARYDPVTDLPNRSELHERIAQALQQASRTESKIALLYLDLDRFKIVNDSIGHQVGDELLRIAAQRIVNCVRSADVVSRLASDEFALLLTHVASKEQACVVAEKLLAKFRSPFVIKGQSFHITLSIGIAYGADDGATAEELLRNADSAMHYAKQAQRDNFQLYNREMHERLQTRLHMEQLLRSALDNKEFLLHYQPFLDASRSEVIGVEALLRWHSPELGMVSPAAFIDILEETGLIVPVGAWVLEESCRQAKQWSDDGLGPLLLSVNVSARQFKDPELVSMVRATLARTAFSADRLQLEITESVLMTDQEASAAKLRTLAGDGIHIAVDDFGTGYSSLGYLKRFSLNTLKIDRSFVKDMIQDADNANIVSAVIALAHNLRLSVTAEGVETAEQFDFLRRNRCDSVQGFLFSKPLSRNDTQAFLHAKRAAAPAKPSLHLVNAS